MAAVWQGWIGSVNDERWACQHENDLKCPKLRFLRVLTITRACSSKSFSTYLDTKKFLCQSSTRKLWQFCITWPSWSHRKTVRFWSDAVLFWSDALHRLAFALRFGDASGESTRLPLMWPGFDSQIRRQVWVEFVGSLLCSEGYSPATPVSPLIKNQNLT